MAEPYAKESWTVQRLLRWAANDFAAKGFDSPRLDSELMLAHVLGVDRVKLIVDSNRELDDAELSRFKALIVRRRAHEPIAYILGQREFYGHVYKVDRRVLIPRPDTETLVEVALERTQKHSMFGRVLDIGTGSGCIALSFAKARPTWRVLATDISEAALEVARENALRLGPFSSVAFKLSDLFGGITPGAKFDLIVSNPPYIPEPRLPSLSPDIVKHEPHLALFSGPSGCRMLKDLIAQAPTYLSERGVLAVEMDSSQTEELRLSFEQAGFRSVRVDQDYGKRDRVVSGRLG